MNKKHGNFYQTKQEQKRTKLNVKLSRYGILKSLLLKMTVVLKKYSNL